jgi:DNA sulfur modification protein DndD
MILDEIVLHNFSVYRGRQSLQLTPPQPTKPIILIGGLNGSGKTTLLDAFQLALYGKFAQCASRGNTAYDAFLRRSIHQAIHPSEGAALEIQFRHTTDGMEHTYRIHRSWSQSGSSMRERVEVRQDGVFDRVLTDAWHEYVETFMPARIAPLFFFDGEKIEGLADVEHAAQLLETAMHSLLGLDLVGQLTTDLLVLERRKRTALKSDEERRDIADAQEELKRLEQQRDTLVLQRGALQNELDQHQKRLRDVENRFRVEGGDLLDQRDILERQRAEIVQRLHTAEAALRDLVAGPTPFLLVTDLLAAVDRQACHEEAAFQAAALSQVLTDRDTQLLAEAERHGVTAETLQALGAFLTADRQQRAASAEIENYLHLSPEARDQLRILQGQTLPDVQEQAQQLLGRIENLQEALADIDRRLARIPDRDAVAHLLEERHQARTALDEAHNRLATLDSELTRVTREYEQQHARLVARLKHTVDTAFEQEATGRVLNHSQRVRKTLEQFRSAVLERHIRRIEQLVLESFRHLVHKEALVTELTIDPDSFTVALRGKDGYLLSPDRLSAGERQLLAVSMLWGLGRAAGRPLPAIIDTPLGRLDASHRTHLVERYFPHASHQVILLSTDEEIDETHYAKLRQWVGRTYRLVFDDTADATRIQPGYFW